MRGFLTTLFLLGAVANVAAQDSDFDVRSGSRGIALNRDLMSVAEMGALAQSPFQYGTARSMAMAGAMTSLGGDASSMMINPAGLGMARTGSFTITPMLTIQSSTTSSTSSFVDNDRTPFALSNFAAIFNLYESSDTKLIALNFGFGYNRIADLNYGYSLASRGNSTSLANLYSRQLTAAEVSLDEVQGTTNPTWDYFPTYLWSAALGYKGGMSDNTGSTTWDSTWIADDASVDQYMAIDSDGSIGEYDISFGGNYDNKLYFGLTLGIQSVSQRLDIYYGEDYDNGTSFSGNELYSANTYQTTITQGVGVNVKLGLTYRPTDALRVGVAFHSPTYYSLNREYQTSVSTSVNYDGVGEILSDDSAILEDYYDNRWKYRSPSRLLVGGSYTFAQRALLSIDYQYEDYGSMSVSNTPAGVGSSLYDYFSDIYQSVSTLRVGGEVKLTPAFALRGGYGFSTSMLSEGVDTALLLDIPTTDKVSFYAAGVGFSPSKYVCFDLTYMSYTTHTSTYKLFYSSDSLEAEGAPAASTAQSGSFKTKIRQNNIALSMVVRM